MEEGLVIRIEPRVWTVEIGDRELPCTLKPRLFELDTGEKNPVAVGDRVMVRVEGDHGVIEEMLPRKNRLARPKPNDPSTLQVT